MMKCIIDSHFTVIPAIGLEGFRSLKGDWDRLAMNNGSYFPFLCYDWYDVWLRHFPDTDMFIPILFRDETIVAIMPLAKITVRKKGFQFNVFEFVGNSYFQARAILCGSIDPVERTLYAEKLLQYFVKHIPRWNYLDLYGLQTENGNFDQITNAATRCGLTQQVERAYYNLYQEGISVSAEEYLSGRPKIVSKDVHYNRRRMQREGTLEFRLVTDSPDMDAIMDTYYNLYAKSWQKSEDLGPTFHRDLVKFAEQKGWLRLGFLLYNGNPIACQLWFVCLGTAYILKTFFDIGFKRYSPGKVLTSDIFSRIIKIDGVTQINFLQGDEEYKKDWVDGKRSRERLLIYSKSLKSIMLSQLINMKYSMNQNKRGEVS